MKRIIAICMLLFLVITLIVGFVYAESEPATPSYTVEDLIKELEEEEFYVINVERYDAKAPAPVESSVVLPSAGLYVDIYRPNHDRIVYHEAVKYYRYESGLIWIYLENGKMYGVSPCNITFSN